MAPRWGVRRRGGHWLVAAGVGAGAEAGSRAEPWFCPLDRSGAEALDAGEYRLMITAWAGDRLVMVDDSLVAPCGCGGCGGVRLQGLIK